MCGWRCRDCDASPPQHTHIHIHVCVYIYVLYIHMFISYAYTHTPTPAAPRSHTPTHPPTHPHTHTHTHVGEIFLIFWRDSLQEIWWAFAGLFGPTKRKAQNIRGKFRSIFRAKIGNSTKIYSEPTSLCRCATLRGCVCLVLTKTIPGVCLVQLPCVSLRRLSCSKGLM